MKNVTILGLDIGGANTKAALVSFKEKKIVDSFSTIEYFPFWQQVLKDIPNIFKKINNKLIRKNHLTLTDIDYIAVTMTAELSDAFQTKREGISTILSALEQVYPREKMFFISVSQKFFNFEDAKKHNISLAAANWVSTALFLGVFLQNCVMIDAGSNTIDIIPILGSIPVAIGSSDITRMINHELIYTGGLRAEIPSIVHKVPYKNHMVRISFEKFALISDIHMILNNITEKEYINETADNRSTSLDNCYARLARILCMDLESISKEELNDLAKFIYEKQLAIITKEFKAFFQNLIKKLPEFKDNPKFVITGLSASFLITPVLIKLGFNNIENYEKITSISDHISSSAFAVAGALYYQLLK